MIVRASQPVPFPAHSFDPVHIHRDGNAKNPGYPGINAVGCIADQNQVELPEQSMENGKKGVDHRVRVFPFQSREDHNPRAPVRFQSSGNVMGAAVDCHIMPSGYQACGAFFGECLKSAIVRRNPACSKNRYLQWKSVWGLHVPDSEFSARSLSL